MRQVLMIRSIPSVEAEAKHERFMGFLATLGGEWGLIPGVEPPKLPPFRSDPFVQVSLSRFFPKGLTAHVHYQNRIDLRNEGKFDDHFALEFDPRKRDFKQLVLNVFELYVRHFDAYLGRIGAEELIELDFEAFRKVNMREGIYRIHPACFFGPELCRKAFNLEPHAIVELARAYVEYTSTPAGGVLLVASPLPSSITQADQFDGLMKRLLGVDESPDGTTP